MLSFLLLCFLLLINSPLLRVQPFNLLSNPPNSRFITVNIKGDGYFIVNQVGDSKLPTSPPSHPSSDTPILFEIEQHSNYLEDLYAMNKLQRDRKILEDLKQIIKESGKMRRSVKSSAGSRNVHIGQTISSEYSRTADDSSFLPQGRSREKPKYPSEQNQHKLGKWERGFRGRRN